MIQENLSLNRSRTPLRNEANLSGMGFWPWLHMRPRLCLPVKNGGSRNHCRLNEQISKKSLDFLLYTFYIARQGVVFFFV